MPLPTIPLWMQLLATLGVGAGVAGQHGGLIPSGWAELFFPEEKAPFQSTWTEENVRRMAASGKPLSVPAGARVGVELKSGQTVALSEYLRGAEWTKSPEGWLPPGAAPPGEAAAGPEDIFKPDKDAIAAEPSEPYEVETTIGGRRAIYMMIPTINEYGQTSWSPSQPYFPDEFATKQQEAAYQRQLAEETRKLAQQQFQQEMQVRRMEAEPQRIAAMAQLASMMADPRIATRLRGLEAFQRPGQIPGPLQQFFQLPQAVEMGEPEDVSGRVAHILHGAGVTTHTATGEQLRSAMQQARHEAGERQALGMPTTPLALARGPISPGKLAGLSPEMLGTFFGLTDILGIPQEQIIGPSEAIRLGRPRAPARIFA